MKAQINQLHLNFGFFLHQLVLAILLIFVMDTVSVSQTTLFVVNGDDNGPGSLRQTLSDAANNDTIRFMAGVDTVYLTSAELLIDKSIVLSGDPAYTCVIKQDTIPKFRIFRIQSTDSLHVEFYNLSITKGHAPDGDAADLHGKHGGGIFVSDSCHDLMLTNCIIRENQAGDGFRTYSASITGSGGSGGGIYSLSKIELFNCQFNNNAAGKGANAASGGDWDAQHAGAGGAGGGIYCTNDLTIENCTIINNHSGAGGYSGGYTFGIDPGSGGHGGGIYSENCTLQVDDCLIAGNYTGKGANFEYFYTGGAHGGSGGGIYIYNLSDSSRLKNCRIENNYAGNGGTFNEVDHTTHSPVANGGSGGGLAINNSFFDIINCVVSGNKGGNAVFKTNIPPGGDYSLPKGGSGGGIYINQSTHRIINCTIANNSAGTAVIAAASGLENIMVSDSVRGKGGGIFPADQPVNAINSIIAGNYILNYSVHNDIEGNGLLNYSLLSTDTLTVIDPGEGNLVNYDPAFLSFPDDLSLDPASLAINQGTPDTTGLSLPALDLAGNTRIYGERIDMGAFEFQGDPLDQYMLSTYEIDMDTVVAGSFVIDSLNIYNIGVTDITVSDIQTHLPFSISLDKISWTNQLDDVSISGGLPITPLEIYVKLEGLAIGLHSDSITVTIGDSVNVVQIRGFCKSTEGINEDEKGINPGLSPNPFNQETMITFSLKESGDVNIAVFNSKGIKVDEIKLINRQEGKNTFTWNRNNLPAGIYFYIMISGKKTMQKHSQKRKQ